MIQSAQPQENKATGGQGGTPLEVQKQLTVGSVIRTWSPRMMRYVCEGRKQKEQRRQRHGDLNTPHGCNEQSQGLE